VGGSGTVVLGEKSLLIGSPTQRFRPTSGISNMLNEIPQNSLKGVKVAAFDTRLTLSEINKIPVLAFFVKFSGDSAYAAKHIANQLKKKGGQLTQSNCLECTSHSVEKPHRLCFCFYGDNISIEVLSVFRLFDFF
jgi:hypothetical protein